MRKRFVYIVGTVMLLSMILVGCSKEPIPLPDVKKYESEISKEDFSFSNFEGTLKEPIPAGEILYTSGKLAKQKHEYVEGELGLRVDRMLRGDAAKYRISDRDLRDLPKKDEEWVMVELTAYNFGNEDEVLVFLEDELKLTTIKGKGIKQWDISLDEDPTRVVVYEGKPEKIVLTAKVKKKQKNFLVKLSKVIEEYPLLTEEEMEELTEDEKVELGITEEREEIILGEGKKGKNKNKDKEKRIVKYLETKDVQIENDFFEEEGSLKEEIEQENKEEDEKGTEKEKSK